MKRRTEVMPQRNASFLPGRQLVAITLGLGLVLAAWPRLSVAESEREQVTAIYRQAMEAYEKKDYATY